MKLTFAFLFLLALGQSSFGASSAEKPLELPGAFAGASAAVTSAIDFEAAREKLEAQILGLAKGHYPNDFVSVASVRCYGSPSSIRLGASDHFFHGFARITLRNMEKELFVYINSDNRLDILCEALPDTLSVNCANGDVKDSSFIYLSTNIQYTSLEGKLQYFRWQMLRDLDTRQLLPSVTNLLPELDEAVKALHLLECILDGNIHLLIAGLHKDKQVLYLAKSGEEPQKIMEERDDSELSFEYKNNNLYVGETISGNMLIIHLFDCATKSWKPTNIHKQPTMLEGFENDDFVVHREKPDHIVCLREPKDGLNNWIFFDEEYESLFSKKMELIRKDWAEKGYPFKDSPINFDFIDPFLCVDDYGSQRFFRNFNFPFGSKGKIYITQEGVVETMIDQTPDLSAFKLKPYVFQRHAVCAEDEYPLPYYTVDRMEKVAAGPRSILWWIQGGPHMEFSQDEDAIMDWFLDNNFLVVIPRERIRGGLGYDHYKAGKGKLDKQALWDAIAPINDLIRKGVADPAKILGYGFSYGGYAMASFATRWTEFAEGAHFKPLGLIAEGALLAPTLSTNNLLVTEMFLPKEGVPGDAKEFLESFFPLYQYNLVMPLFVIHGLYDHRCSIADAREFYKKFQANPFLMAYVEHPKAHRYMVGERGEEDSGLRIVQAMVSSLLSDINPATLRGRQLATAGIDIKKGADLLGVIPSVSSYNLHLYGF